MSSHNAVTVVAYITVNDKSDLEMIESTLKTTVQAVKQEPGCEMYALHRNNDHPLQFIMIEKWSSPQMLEQHSQAAALQNLGRVLAGKAQLEVKTMQLIA
ncbi:putative quinol monooxygenase [Moellerella wisconsensis]|uniref:Antibiotic biosynthesis monooxygenase n=1 Tax=Moellerella wisconsensis TaxID=158849 RepID=A0ACD3Y5F0_9GAMM|nr:antibiotic biosynthesis monooxygenase [Moellerella wisconsensis]KLN96973.1 hypothetical protein VK86_07160 [Moellerella wisconsensis]UNH23474.1 antibiotic biosynthesis monooxygenase [Moellerella wisconsensis]UNH38195.1 antibiotic biosynthesis monooxygenase [Moellerella wisconsensis]UNH41690.1 antibiotic biosynthesis monooxygenase [Moellerella wisconsensis]WJW81204.1 antibiotic biosynthesis monooxygenase [Moellerella wisconsensis]